MMQHNPPLAPQFFVTAPQPCPYLAGRFERKLFTALQGPETETLNNSLSRQGFRRSQNVLYRPACASCNACMSVRIKLDGFEFSRNQRRLLAKNANLERSANAPWATDEQYELFSRYLSDRHHDGGMMDMDVFEFAAMIEETPVRSRVIEYRDATGPLTAACLTDVLDDGLSMVYSFFDTTKTKQSLGRFMILDHIRLAKEIGLPYLYLGYWVSGSPKMDYKARFENLEIYHNQTWSAASQIMDHITTTDPMSVQPISDQVNALDLGSPLRSVCAMTFSLHAFTILVPSYDAGIEFYVGKLGFDLVQDTELGSGKRWVLIRPNTAQSAHILLAEPTTTTQQQALGQQTGGRVGFFLLTDDFDADYQMMQNAGVTFEEQPRFEPYGTVAVWQDPFGNRWDLLHLTAQPPSL